MAAGGSALKVVAGDVEMVSTSGSEDAPLREQTARTRGTWKVVAIASVMASIVVVGTSWTRNDGTLGEKSTVLETPWYKAGGYGCGNWKDIQLNSSTAATKDACAAACEVDTKCTAYNWQATPCSPPAGENQSNVCMLFHGSCVPKNNTCWELTYRTEPTDAVTQVLTVRTTPHPNAESVRVAVKAAVEENGGFSPVGVVSTENAPALGTASIAYNVTWRFEMVGSTGAALAFARNLVENASALVSFGNVLKTKLSSATVVDVDVKDPILGF